MFNSCNFIVSHVKLIVLHERTDTLDPLVPKCPRDTSAQYTVPKKAYRTICRQTDSRSVKSRTG